MEDTMMFLCIRYWDINTSKVLTQYFNSASIDMPQHMTCTKISQNLWMTNQMLSKIIQLLMGRPHVNWKFYEQLTDELDARFDSPLLDMGSCSLHEVQGAMHDGVKLAKWKFNVSINSLNMVQQDELTIYQKFTVSKSFPLNFILQDGLKTRELH